MSVVDAAYDEAVKTVESCVKKIQRAYNDIAHKVSWALKFLPDPLDKQVRTEMGKLHDKYKEHEVMMADLWLERGSAGALRDAANEWVLKVGGVASKQSTELAFAAMPSNGVWEGDAQKAYRPIVDLHSRVLNDFFNWNGDLSDTLNALADALKVYWVAIAIDAVGCAVALAACAVAGETVVALAAAIVAAVGAIVAFWVAVAGHTVLYHNTLDALEGKLVKIRAINGEDARWPHGAADLSDASVLDGDKSGWERPA
jgi:hypothetical protein